MKTILSGIRPTGRLHFGSLLGAVQQFVAYQNDPDNRCLYFVADYHALTTLDDAKAMRENLIEMIKDYLAAGLDPERSILYAQSSIPEIPELMWYLATLQPRGELDRIPTLSDLRRSGGGITLGMMSYPVLMAADILGPQANVVPVGEDQRPNIELARRLAESFNHRYERDVFTLPEAPEELLRVPGLDGGKMGKSNAQNAIAITMSREEVLKRYLRHGVTDINRVTLSDPGEPGECKSVYPVHRLVTESEMDGEGVIAAACRQAQIGCADCKKQLVENIMAVLEPFQERRQQFNNQDDYVCDLLAEGAKAARAIIAPTVETVAECMGITRFTST